MSTLTSSIPEPIRPFLVLSYPYPYEGVDTEASSLIGGAGAGDGWNETDGKRTVYQRGGGEGERDRPKGSRASGSELRRRDWWFSSSSSSSPTGSTISPRPPNHHLLNAPAPNSDPSLPSGIDLNPLPSYAYHTGPLDICLVLTCAIGFTLAREVVMRLFGKFARWWLFSQGAAAVEGMEKGPGNGEGGVGSRRRKKDRKGEAGTKEGSVVRGTGEDRPRPANSNAAHESGNGSANNRELNVRLDSGDKAIGFCEKETTSSSNSVTSSSSTTGFASASWAPSNSSSSDDLEHDGDSAEYTDSAPVEVIGKPLPSPPNSLRARHRPPQRTEGDDAASEIDSTDPSARDQKRSKLTRQTTTIARARRTRGERASTVSKREVRRRNGVITRFSEQGWSFTYCLVYWSFGLYILSHAPCFPFRSSYLWATYPDYPLQALTKFYYLSQLGFWFHQLLVLQIEKRRNDHWQMFSHHIITIGLIAGSYWTNFTKIGVVIHCLMDFVDILLPLAKMFRYLGMPTLTDATFVLFLVAWLITRQIGFFALFLSTCFRATSILPMTWDPANGNYSSWTCLRIFQVLLGALQVMSCMWFIMACNVAYRVVSGKGAEDIRSEDEGAPDDSDDDELLDQKEKKAGCVISAENSSLPSGVEGILLQAGSLDVTGSVCSSRKASLNGNGTARTQATNGKLHINGHQQYSTPPMTAADLASSPLDQFKGWLHEALESSGSGSVVREPEAMTISTCSSAGVPSSRIVLLKAVDPLGFSFYTNYNSRKSREMLENPYASACFYWREMARQVRVVGTVEKVSLEDSREYFASRPRGSQISAIVSEQSSVVTEGEVQARADELEAKMEGFEVECPEHWGGWRLVPFEVEFWMGKENRLHDRFRYTRPEGSQKAWSIDQLAP